MTFDPQKGHTSQKCQTTEYIITAFYASAHYAFIVRLTNAACNESVVWH